MWLHFFDKTRCLIIGCNSNIGLVLVGVKGNAKLGTTVNVMLGWICTIGILEGTFGLLAKCLIFGKLLIVVCFD